MADRAGAPPPEPPFELPPGRLVHVPGRGELFVRDSGGNGPPVLLLHGWMFQGDLTWFRCYGPLTDAGYRVIALDHRGHGRGLRTSDEFRLSDCADDAAALVRHLGCAPVTAVGYSMGGAIAQLLARDHRELLSSLVLSATPPNWTERGMRILWRSMGVLRLLLGVFPTRTWSAILRRGGFPDDATTAWIASELSRGSSLDIAEAGRELGRFDSRGWLHRIEVPAAVVVTARDRSVPPRKQRELVERLGARSFEVPADHGAVLARPERYREVLVQALDALHEARAQAA
jgi:3-oxoadipate enol-lactonase